jgi:hypothetical protein
MFPSSGHGLGPGGRRRGGLRKKREKKARSAINASEGIIPVRRLPTQWVNPPGFYEHSGSPSVRSQIRSHLEFSGAQLITASSMTDSSHNLVVHHLNNSRSQRILWLLVRLVTYSSPFLLTQKQCLSHQGRARGALRDQILPTRLKSTCPKGTPKRQSAGESPRHHRW